MMTYKGHKLHLMKVLTPNYQTWYGKTALQIPSYGGREDIVHLLLEQYQANPNIADNWGHSPLTLATGHGHNEIVVLLLSSEADINHCNNRGISALNSAQSSIHKNVVQTLK